MGDNSRLFIDGTTLDTLLAQNHALHGMSMWKATEFWKIKEKMKGSENSAIVLLNDSTIDSSTSGQISSRTTTKKNQCVALLAGQLGVALEMHTDKDLDGGLSRCTISFSDRTKDDGLMRIANKVDNTKVIQLTKLFYELGRYVVSDFDTAEVDRLKGRSSGLIFGFMASVATNTGVEHYTMHNHVENIRLEPEILESKEELDNIDEYIPIGDTAIIKSEKCSGIEYWYCWHNAETGGDLKLMPRDMIPLLQLISDKSTPHLYTRVCRKFVDFAFAIQILYALEKSLINNSDPFDIESIKLLQKEIKTSKTWKKITTPYGHGDKIYRHIKRKIYSGNVLSLQGGLVLIRYLDENKQYYYNPAIVACSDDTSALVIFANDDQLIWGTITTCQRSIINKDIRVV